jgi:hypothetical protein
MLLITDGLPRGLGYVEVDHRATPGNLIPAGLPRHFEADTYTCTHCQRVVVLNPLRKRERYKCGGCNHHICDDCAAARVNGAACKTWAQVVDEIAERAIRQLDTAPTIAVTGE